jgi:hypothetical protein
MKPVRFGAERIYLDIYILIAAGALSPAVGGSLLKIGLADMLYLSEFAGAVLMYIGFVMATSGKTE